MCLGSVSFVVPMYNERQAIPYTVDELKRIARDISDDYEIIISDDASTDGSSEIIDKMAKEDNHIKTARLNKNSKFGGALAAGIKKAKNDIIIYTDSDLPVEEKDIKGALLLLEGSDIVTAYSKVKKGESPLRKFMSKVYNLIIESFFRTNIKDINSGFKIYRRRVFDNMELKSRSPFIDVEIFIRAMRKNCSIRQYPIIFKPREKGASHISRFPVILATLFDVFKFKLGD